MASVTMQLILYRFQEIKNNIYMWMEKMSTKYYNLSMEDIDVLDLYVLVWILATLASLIIIKIITKCIQLKVFHLMCFWISFTVHYITQLVQQINFLEKFKTLVDILDYKIKSLGNCNDDLIKWILSSSTFTQQFQEKFLQSLNKETHRILVDSNLFLTFLSIKISADHSKIRNKITTMTGEKTLVVRFSFDSSDIDIELKASTSDWLKTCQLQVKHISGEARLELTWASPPQSPLLPSSSSPPITSSSMMESIELILSVEHLMDLLVEHSVASSEEMPYNMEDVICKVIVNSKIQINLTELAASPNEILVTDSSPMGMNLLQPSNHIITTSPSRNVCDSKLLVRLIKIESLSLPVSATGSAPIEIHCRTSLDHPLQRYSTTSIKNTPSPYFDETFLFSVSPTSKQLTIEVFCISGGVQILIGACSRTLDELKQSPYRKFLALNGSKRQPISDFDTNSSHSQIHVPINNESPKMVRHDDSINIQTNNGNLNIHEISGGGGGSLSSLMTIVKKSCGTLCAEFLFMENETSKFPNFMQPDFSLSSDLDLTGSIDTHSIRTHQSKSSASISRALDPQGTPLKHPSGRTPRKVKSSELLASSNVSIQSGRTLTNDLDEALEEEPVNPSIDQSINQSNNNNNHKKKWSLLTSIRRRLGEGGSRSRDRDDERNKFRSKSAEAPTAESSPSTSKSVYNHYQCTPLRRHRHRRILDKESEDPEQLSHRSSEATNRKHEKNQQQRTDRFQQLSAGLKNIFSRTRSVSPSIGYHGNNNNLNVVNMKNKIISKNNYDYDKFK